MKPFTIVLPDEQAPALDRAVVEGDFATPSDLIVTVIEEFLNVPFAYDPDALARDIAEHEAEKARGEAGHSPKKARAWLAAQRSAQVAGASGRAAGFSISTQASLSEVQSPFTIFSSATARNPNPS